MEKYQTFWRRFGAGLIDALVLYPINWIDPFLSSPERNSITLILWALFSYTIFWFYNVYFHAKTGQTIGKRVSGVKVMDVSEERLPTWQQSLMRDSFYVAMNVFALLYFIYLVITRKYFEATEINAIPNMIIGISALVWFVIEIITMATNSKSRAFHDYLAKTVVVKNI